MARITEGVSLRQWIHRVPSVSGQGEAFQPRLPVLPAEVKMRKGWLGHIEAVPQESQPLGHRFAMPQPPLFPSHRYVPATNAAIQGGVVVIGTGKMASGARELLESRDFPRYTKGFG